MRRLLALSALLAGVAAVPAAAQTPTNPVQPQPAPQQPPAEQQPAPAPAPAAKLTLATERDRLVLARRSFRVAGRLTPATAGQKVVVRLYRGTRKLQAKSVAVDAEGRFRTKLTARRTGTVTVRASHRATPELGTAVAGPVRLDVLPRRISGGQRGLAVRIVQRHLKKRGYVIGRPGLLDGRTARAVLAFRKVSGLRRTMNADLTVMRRLADGGGVFKVRYPGHGKHIEADLSRQVFAMIRGRKVERIYHTSTGSPATPTIRGSFKFYRSQPGTNAKGMVHSSYFIRGYAIHGYKSVPIYPASHGCLRVPIADALSIFRWIKLGDRIDVYV
jgi:hypothetical protein